MSRAAAAARARAGRWWRAQIRPEALSSAFQDLFGLELEDLQLLAFGPCEIDGLSLGADVQLMGEDVNVRLSLSPELVSRVVGSAASRPKRVDVGSALAEPLRGAMHAIVAELCRRAARGAPLVPTRKQPSEAPWRADFSFRLGGASYRGSALLGLAEGSFGASSKIAPDAAMPLSLPLVVATAVTTASQLESLRRGDAFMFGSQPPAGLVGTTATLCAKNSERGFSVSIDERGLVLQGARALSYELEEPMSGVDEDNTTRDTVAEAAVIVRIEIGTVTMSVAEWLALAPGEVLHTDVPIGAPAVLRLGTDVVGRGELVNVDGQVGVRITSLPRDRNAE